MATVDSRRDKLVVVSLSQTTDGFWIWNESFDVLDADVDDERLGISTLDALAQSRQSVPTPPPDADGISHVLTALRLSSYASYVKGTKSVGVEREKTIVLYPRRNRGARNGFEEIEGQDVELSRDSYARALGEAVREALERAV